MDIQIKKKGRVAVVKCSGSLDAETVASFKKEVAGIVDAGIFNFVMDCSALSFIDSIGLGALISLVRRSREKSGDVKLCSISPDIEEIFEITRLHRLFDITKSERDALKKFQDAI